MSRHRGMFLINPRIDSVGPPFQKTKCTGTRYPKVRPERASGAFLPGNVTDPALLANSPIETGWKRRCRNQQVQKASRQRINVMKTFVKSILFTGVLVMAPMV